MNRIEYNIIYKGPVIKYLLGGVEDIFWGYEKIPEPLRGVRKKTTEPLGGTKILVL
jgi:hypothetical protein